MKFLFLLVLLLSAPIWAKVQYYRPSDVGADSLFNPIDYYINASFDATQNPYYFQQDNYFKNHEDLWDDLKNPFGSIKKDGGYNEFFKDQIIGKPAFPNFVLHLGEGGFHTRKLEDWYQLHGYSHPRAWAIVTRYLGSIGNEAVEISNSKNLNSFDHIADIYIFDLAGILLFQNDNVGRFFIEDMGGDSWHFQPMFNPSDRHVYNAATNLVLRPPIKNSSVRPFFTVGMQGLLGASFDTYLGSFSLGTGIAPTDPLNNHMRWATGLFYDVKGNLMSSLLINSTGDYRVRLNIYPGLVGVKSFRPGFFYAMDHNSDHQIGINFKIPIGLMATIK